MKLRYELVGKSGKLFDVGRIRRDHGDDLTCVVFDPGLARDAKRFSKDDSNELRNIVGGSKLHSRLNVSDNVQHSSRPDHMPLRLDES